MKFLPFFLAPFVLARASNDSKATSDDLEKLFLDAKKKIDWQNKEMESMEKSFRLLKSHGQKQTMQTADRFKKKLDAVKTDHLKWIVDTVEKKEKFLRKKQVKVESQKNKIASAEKTLSDVKVEGVKELERVAEATKLLQSAKSENESQAEKLVKAEELILVERNKVKGKAEDVASAAKLLHDLKKADKLQAKNISKVEKSLRDLKKKCKEQADDLAKVEPLRSIENPDDKQAKKVEAAKTSLRELSIEVKAQGPKLLAAGSLITTATTTYEEHLKKLTAATPSLDAIKWEGAAADPDVAKIQEVLHEVHNNSVWEAKKIKAAEKLIKALTN